MNLSGRVVTVDRTRVVCSGKFSSISAFLGANSSGISKIIILVDENTGRLCLPVLKKNTSLPDDAFVLEIPAGEESKTIQTATKIWQEMLAAKADRKTLLINLGGGMISDLGGFVAAGFKRGITYINIPTTLMGQADASIGGKTAVNFDGIKNQIGFFHSPAAVFIFPEFLKTLPVEHFRAGLAEIIKCALISDPVLWRKVKRMSESDLSSIDKRLLDLISKTVAFKNSVVRKDFREKGWRKILNFGHTIGHAFESLSQTDNRQPLLHGEAVAIGLICESHLSHLKTGLCVEQVEEVKSFIGSIFPLYPLTRDDIPHLIGLMEHDKKNRDGLINFTLLNSIGTARINGLCNHTEIIESLDYYLK
jgi:3-dehydroquinate synthase